jgi:putative component of toxin-antitoxin plasmid stabilization module
VKEVKDAKAKTIIISNLERAAGGLFGGWKAIAVAGGLCEAIAAATSYLADYSRRARA